jgi:hypothetical protein
MGRGPRLKSDPAGRAGLLLAAFARCLSLHLHGLRCAYADAGLLATSTDDQDLDVVADS